MPDFTEHFSKLCPRIQGYIFFQHLIREDLGSDSVVGIFCASPSIVRKESILERVNEEISSLELPLVITEFDNDNKYFKIVKK
ncbi:MAG: hypothetical protein ABI091_25815 [Ferruginibacter sp.]|jgi:hypothetical protein